MTAENDPEYEIPLRDQRNFGRGYRKRGIAFVRSEGASVGKTSSQATTAVNRLSAADRYLAIALGTDTAAIIDEQSANAEHGPASDSPPKVCYFCSPCQTAFNSAASLDSHMGSIAHQVKLSHSHAPSSVDRGRMGLSVLRAHGWDPDSRQGLGTDNSGILHPIKAKENPDRAGLGARYDPIRKVEKPIKLDAGRMHDLQRIEKSRAEALRREFYGNNELAKYLGSAADGSDMKDGQEESRLSGPKHSSGRWI